MQHCATLLVVTTIDATDAPEKQVEAKRSTRALVLDVLSAAARFFMAYVWIKAAIPKIGAVLDVTQTIAAYEIFTRDWSYLLAHIIGPLELAGGLLLLLGIKLRPAGWVSIGVLSLFIIGMLSAWQRGLIIDCGCFDPNTEGTEGTNLLATVGRDVIYIAITLFMIYRPFKKFAIYP
ncbi:hypothetical protein CKJ85_11660 [Corynebacterium sp. NML 150383]|uniref:Methylamine utilisation protein MauE domain-containing protein n=2 Tax=Corynebacterium TaxID=1716 RepID=A0A269PFH9_9CORY|nr:hypothetical protein CIG21_01480 [Corynebacterium hadale]PAT02749.1 hypothetical protein CKJ85_11660 [Corynebacterium sp. NML 150383]RMD17911.1 hypothetical protein EAW56_10445 [Corynebacterium gottingense]TVX75796.1 hypothetical protein FPP74_12025 [Corynebacterium sp. NML180780]PAT13757.1 hypothetical protein CKJ83_02765 [Corynebacterium hadale]